MGGHRPLPVMGLACALVLAFVVAPGAAAPRATATGAPGMPGALRTTTLPNGLRVVLAPDSEAAALDVAVWYEAGLRAEPPGRAGIAHLFERLMFDGSTNVPRRGHQTRIESLGGSSESITTADAICFFETVPASGLDTALALEADRMTGLTLDAGRIDAERSAIGAERSRASQGSPVATGERLLAETAWSGHPYHAPITGSETDLAKLTLRDAQDWYHARYGPGRAVLTLVGRFDPGDAMKRIRSRFGSLKGGDAAAPATKLATPAAERRVRVAGTLPFRLLAMGWNVPGRDDPDAAALTLLAAILARGETSRLHADLVGRQRSCFFLDGDVDARRDGSLLYVVAGVQPGADSAAVERAILAAVEHAANGPPGDAELEGARKQLVNAICFGWQSARGRAQALGSAVMTTGDATAATRALERVRACTAADVQHAAARWLTATRRIVVWQAARPGETAAASGGAR
ncbi:MAG: M16 family metallopeptidase [Candidatus Eisenbacteria bacterium]